MLSSAIQALIDQVWASAPEQDAGQGKIKSQNILETSIHAARLLQEWDQDENLQAAAILHKFVYNVELPYAELLAKEDEPVARLCADYAQLLLSRDDFERGKAHAHQRVRHFIAAYHNPDLALVATALLWAQLQHRFTLAPAQAAAAQEEARLVLCPVLDMLGMQALREDLYYQLWPVERDAANALLLQAAYENVVDALVHVLPGATFERRFPCLEPGLGNRRNVPSTVDMAICMPTVEHCYQALYQIHQQCSVIDGSFADSLRLGRANGWRALQTAIVHTFQNDRVRINFQIYAAEMEPVNRWGLAAVRRKQGPASSAANAWWHNAAEGKAQIESASVGTLPETLYVFSPQGQLFRFHRGCTVIDFAYHVHTDLADRCRRFYINDAVVEPGAVLHHLDLVSLEHDPQAPGPTQIWLNAAHTTRARHAIERFLNRRGQGVDQGRRILDERRGLLEEHYGFNLPEHRLAQATTGAMRQLHLSRLDELLDEIAAGRLAADQLLHPLFAEEIARQIQIPRGLGVRPHQLQIAQCCRPRPGEDIVGLVTRRHQQITRLRVHQQACARIDAHPEQIPLGWRLQPRLTVPAQLEVTAHDEDELLGDAVKQIYAQLPHVTLHKVEGYARRGVARLRFHVEAENQEVLDRLMAALQTLPNYQIVEVRQMRLPPSELEMVESTSGAAAFNPYSRLPVNEQAMFFGRSQELQTIQEWLRADMGNIWLLGQKRVGKTSLLLHLKNHLLPERGYVAAFVDFQLLGNLATGNLFYEIAAAVFADLQDDPRCGQMGPPLRSLFDIRPAAELIAYLRALRDRLGATRLVLLLDEFSRTSDAYLQDQLDRSFFETWRGILQATIPQVNYIIVVQQQTYDLLSRRAQQNMGDPSWHMMELGEKLLLKPLGQDDVRRLIEWPMRNFLEFSPESVDYVAALTGGNPFLIQAFCFKLAAHMARQERNRIEWQDIEMVRLEFMSPAESVFAHFLDMIRGVANQVSQTVAALADEHEHAGGAPVAEWSDIAAALPALPPDVLRRTLQELVSCDILLLSSPDAWAFCSRLFQQWLAVNQE